MNTADWIKAAALVTQHKQEAAMAEMDQLSSMLLSQIAMQNGMHMPIAVSTLTDTDVHTHSSQQEDSYQQIIPGLPQGSLYLTLSSLSSEAVASNDETQSLHNRVSKGLDKYLQDAEQHRELELNYFDDTTRLCQKLQSRQMNLLSITYPQPSKCLWKRQNINTISIMVMIMSTRRSNMVHHVHYAVAIITLLNIVLRENMISMILWKR